MRSKNLFWAADLIRDDVLKNTGEILSVPRLTKAAQTHAQPSQRLAQAAQRLVLAGPGQSGADSGYPEAGSGYLKRGGMD